MNLISLDPGSPVPVLVGTPAPAARAKAASPWRASWGPENHAGVLSSPKAMKRTTPNFDDRTPVKAAAALVRKSSSDLNRSKIFVAEKGDHPCKIPKSPFPTDVS